MILLQEESVVGAYWEANDGQSLISTFLGKGRMVHLPLYVLLLSCFGTWTVSLSVEEFSEELLLRPLPDGKVLTHFHFTNKLPPTNSYGQHHRLFPKTIYQLARKSQIKEMEISFTQGRWNYDRWGGMDPLVRSNAKPSGVELWAVFGVPDELIDATWRNLTHALSGLFCASLNFLESPAMIANPVRTFRPDLGNSRPCNLGTGTSETAATCCHQPTGPACIAGPTTKQRLDIGGKKRELLGRMRYGALPREAVCTENLTPWLKLLPCRDKAGLATLLDRPVIYKGWYHSLRLYVRSDEFESQVLGGREGTLLQQTLTLAIQPSQTTSLRPGTRTTRMQPDWSLSSLFGRDLSAGCPLAKSSVVYLELEGPLVEKIEQSGAAAGLKERSTTCKAQDLTKPQAEYSQGSALLKELVKNNAYALNGSPENIFWDAKFIGDIGEDKVLSNFLLSFAVPKHANARPLDVGISWKVPLVWTPTRGPFRATRFLVGSGNARSAIAIVLKSNQPQASSPVEMGGQTVSKMASPQSVTDVMIFQVVPWYIRLYLHTLQVLVDEEPRPFQEVVTWMQVIPSEDRRSPGVIEMELRIPSNAYMITLIADFDKGILRIDEHPPDANRGFDLPSALISFPHQRSERQYQLASSESSKAQDSPLLQDFWKEKPVQVYTEVLLVPLATPDFSMPYNVITLTCTVLALYFGSLLNILRRRIGEEERLANSGEASPLRKLERLISKIVGFHNGRNKVASSSKVLRLFKFLFLVLVAVGVNYFLTK